MICNLFAAFDLTPTKDGEMPRAFSRHATRLKLMLVHKKKSEGRLKWMVKTWHECAVANVLLGYVCVHRREELAAWTPERLGCSVSDVARREQFARFAERFGLEVDILHGTVATFIHFRRAPPRNIDTQGNQRTGRSSPTDEFKSA